MAKHQAFPIPGVFIPGVPVTVQEFESKADLDRFLKGETGGRKHASVFTATKAEANAAAIITPDDGDK